MSEHLKIRDGAFELPDLATLPPDGGEEYNRLIFTKSPYLLQHARNPVDWFPWGKAAFDRAREENKPIFLSIGYSTCHWCHVMEHESFEDPEVAAFLNEHFVSIKLDREERPDIDNIYMTVCQAMTGGGGWPLTIFMTPSQQPFFAGTYFPKDDGYGRPGFMKLLYHISEAWKTEREKIGEITSDIAGMLTHSQHTAPAPLNAAVVEKAVRAFSNTFDRAHGGFGNAPKFPMAHGISFLLQQYRATRDRDILDMAERTLDAMYRGGMYDHIGYGFCRYSTDAQWLVPHFEKMLYDNALLMHAYADAYQLTGKPFYKRVAEEIAEYIRRDMTANEGGFYSAENADSEGVEGKFYVFTRAELLDVLGQERGTLAAEYFGITDEGNFEEGTSIAHIPVQMEEWAAKNGMASADAETFIAGAREDLFRYRAKRVHPSLDDKILTGWNGLMIAALARAGFALNDRGMIFLAQTAADFVLTHIRRDDGTLMHQFGNNEIAGFADDYAFFVWGLIELYQATFNPVYLAKASALNAKMLALFRDEESGGLFYTPHNGEQLIARTKDYYDGALPSGNSAAAYNCVRLSRLTGDMELARTAEAIMTASGGAAAQHPTGATVLLTAYACATGTGKEIVLAADSRKDIEPFLDVLRRTFLPGSVALFHQPGGEGEALRNVAGYVAPQLPVGGMATAYVCEQFQCNAPVTSVEEFERLLR